MANEQYGIFSKYTHRINRDNSIDFMRYVLSISVLLMHFNATCRAHIPWMISSYDAVGVFFAISGFVLIGKLFRGLSFKQYLINRMWRLFPSYFFVVITTAVGFCLISTLPVSDYFSSSGFWKYLAANLGFLNFLHPDLPGIFTQGAANAVNGSLWTMKIEIQLSLLAPLFVWICRKYRLDVLKAIAVIILFSILYRLGFHELYNITGKQIYIILGRQFFGQLLYFFAGILIYCLYPYFIRHLKYIIPLTLTIYILSRYIIDIPLHILWLDPLVVTGLVLGISLLPVNLSRHIGGRNNISYELYLCHFPIIILIDHYGIPGEYGVFVAFLSVIFLSFAYAAITYFTVGRLYKKMRNS